MAYSKAKLKSNGNEAYFHAILNRKHLRLMLAYPDSSIGCIQTPFE